MKTLESFDLTQAWGRSYARKCGFDVPRRPPGSPPKDFDSQLQWVDGCHVWVGMKNRDGYGVYCRDGKNNMAHRYAYERAYGTKIGKLVLRHTCDTPACCNLAHLIPGTHQQNQADKVAKNRHAKGESTGTSRLTEAQVIRIRLLYADRAFTQKQLAVEFGVCLDTVHKIINRTRWGHVD
jgi:hypothetical protein